MLRKAIFRTISVHFQIIEILGIGCTTSTPLAHPHTFDSLVEPIPFFFSNLINLNVSSCTCLRWRYSKLADSQSRPLEYISWLVFASLLAILLCVVMSVIIISISNNQAVAVLYPPPHVLISAERRHNCWSALISSGYFFLISTDQCQDCWSVLSSSDQTSKSLSDLYKIISVRIADQCWIVLIRLSNHWVPCTKLSTSAIHHVTLNPQDSLWCSGKIQVYYIK